MEFFLIVYFFKIFNMDFYGELDCLDISLGDTRGISYLVSHRYHTLPFRDLI